MTAQEFFQATTALSGLLFIVTSMLAMGMGLRMAQNLQPLNDVRLVILAAQGGSRSAGLTKDSPQRTWQ